MDEMERAVWTVSSELEPRGIGVRLTRFLLLEDGNRRSICSAEAGRLTIPEADVEERKRLYVRFRDVERGLGSHCLLIGRKLHDARVLEVVSARRDFVLWDFDNLCDPLLRNLEGQSSVVFYWCGPPLSGIDLRSAVREGVRCRGLDSTVLRLTSLVPLWSDDARASIAKALLEGLPTVDPARTQLVVGAPAPNPLLAQLNRMPAEARREAIGERPAEIAAAAQLSLLVEELVSTADDAGVDVELHVGQREFQRRLTPRRRGETLLLLAHQDQEGIHLNDGPFPLGELPAVIEGAQYPFDAVDLAVCWSERENNLAAMFHGARVPLVLTRGDFSYQSMATARWIGVMKLLQRGVRASIAELHDLAWLEEIGETASSCAHACPLCCAANAGARNGSATSRG